MVQAVAADLERVLLSAEELAGHVRRLAGELDQAFAETRPIVIGALTGSFVVVADLVRAMTLPVRVDFVSVSSYGAGSTSSGELTWEKGLGLEVHGEDVILVEDIVDTGETLARLQAYLLGREPRRLATVALLDKPARRTVPVRLDHVGVRIPDDFVVGYGLDYAQRYRHLPYVAVLRREVYG